MRPVLFFMLLLVSAPASAEWVKLGESDAVNYYVDNATIYVEANIRRVWLIQDLKQADKDGERSVRGLLQLNCTDGRSRFISSSTYPEPMAGGTALWSSEAPSEWSPTPPNSAVAQVLKLICRM